MTMHKSTPQSKSAFLPSISANTNLDYNIKLQTSVIPAGTFGATETNPLIANLTQSNMLLFSVVKLSAITLTGLIFYRAETQAKLTSKISPFAKKFLNAGYVTS